MQPRPKPVSTGSMCTALSASPAAAAAFGGLLEMLKEAYLLLLT